MLTGTHEGWDLKPMGSPEIVGAAERAPPCKETLGIVIEWLEEAFAMETCCDQAIAVLMFLSSKYVTLPAAQTRAFTLVPVPRGGQGSYFPQHSTKATLESACRKQYQAAWSGAAGQSPERAWEPSPLHSKDDTTAGALPSFPSVLSEQGLTASPLSLSLAAATGTADLAPRCSRHLAGLRPGWSDRS